MKVDLSADLLRPAVESAASLAPGTMIKPILETLLFSVTDDGAVTISATDYTTTSIRFCMVGEGDGIVPGSTCLPSRNLLRLVKQAKGKTLTFSWDEGCPTANVSFGRTSVDLAVERALDFPEVSRFDPSVPSVSLPVADLNGLLKRVNFAVAKDFRSRILAGVRFQTIDDILRVTATDGIRMAVAERKIDNTSGCSIDAVSLPVDPKSLVRIAGKDGTVAIQYDKALGFNGQYGEQCHNTMRGRFPAYDLRKQLGYTKAVTVETEALQTALERAALLKAKGQDWKFTLTDEAMAINARSGLEGNVDTVLPVNWQHDEFAMRLDPVLLLDAVKKVSAEQVELSFGTDRQPALMQETIDDLTYLFALGARV
jgi:DNA polymerase-3 subunit beta